MVSPTNKQEAAPPSIPVGRASGRRWGLLIGAVAVGLIGVFWFARYGLESIEPAQATRSQLVLREDRLFIIGQTNPFTGLLLEHYEDTSLKSRSRISKGLLQGLSEGWHTNGVLAVQEHFEAGISQGLRTKWYATGRKMSEAKIEEGELHGTFRRWHENGVLAEQIEMRHGNAEGLSLAYYPSGFLKAQARVREGQLVEQKFWQDGEVRQPETPPSGL